MANLGLAIPRNPVCARDDANILVLNAQKGVGYQVFSEGIAQTGVFTADENTNFPLVLNHQLEAANFRVEASRSPGCTRLIEDSVSLEMITLFPSFSIDAKNIPINSPLNILNTSPDSLTYQWTVSNGTNSAAMHPNPVSFSKTTEQTIHLEVTSPYGCKETRNKGLTSYDPATLSDFWLLKEGTSTVRDLNVWKMQIDEQDNIYYAYNKSPQDGFHLNTQAGKKEDLILKK